MKSFKILLLVSLVGASFQAAAEVKIHLERDIQPLVINGDELGFSLGKKNDFELKNGQNQMVVQVSKLVQNKGEYEKFNSSAIVVTFSASDTSVTVAPDGKIITTEDAQKYNKNPILLLTGSSGKKINAEQDILKPLSGITRDYLKELTAYNKSNGIAVASSAAIVTAAALSEKANAKDRISKSQEMVEYWYSEATPEEKSSFSNWAFQNRKQVSGELSGKSTPSQMLDYWYKKASPEQRADILSWLLKVE